MSVEIALVTAAAGFTTTSIASAFAQATTDPTTTQWVTGSSAALAVAALAYIARQLASGKLVARDVAIAERELRARAAKADDTVERVLELARMAHEREERLFNFLANQERPG